MQILIRAEIFKEGDQYTSICPELNLSSFGDTPQEARAGLKEATSLFLEECVRMGSLKEILEEAGFSYVDQPVSEWISPQPINIEQIPVETVYA